MGNAVDTRSITGSLPSPIGTAGASESEKGISLAGPEQKALHGNLRAAMDPPPSLSKTPLGERRTDSLSRDEAQEAQKKKLEAKIANTQAQAQKLEREIAASADTKSQLEQDLRNLEKAGPGQEQEVEKLKSKIDQETQRLSRDNVLLAKLQNNLSRSQSELNTLSQSLPPPVQPQPATLPPVPPNPPSQPPPAAAAPVPQPATQTPPEVRAETPPPPVPLPGTPSAPPNLDNLRAQIVDSSGPNVNIERMDGQLGQIQGTFDQLTQIQKQIPAEGRPTPDQLAGAAHLKATLVDEFKALATLEGVSPEMQKTLEGISQAIADMPDIVYLGGDDKASKHLPQTQEDPQKAAAHALQTAQVQIQKEPTQSPKEAAKNAAVQSVEGGHRSPASAAAAATTTAQTTQTENTEEAQRKAKTPSERYLEKKEKLEEKHSKELKELDKSEEEEIKDLEKEEKKELDELENKDDADAQKEIKEKFDQKRKEVEAKYDQKKKELEEKQAEERDDLDREYPESALEEKQKAEQSQDPRFHKDKEKDERRKGKHLADEIGYSEGESVAGTEKRSTRRGNVSENGEPEEADSSLLEQITGFLAGIFGKH